MAQSSTTVVSKSTSDLLTAAEVNNMNTVINGNATDAESRLASLEAGNKFGFMDYNDSGTSVTPVTLLANTWTDIPNNGAGAFTNSTYKPAGVTDLLDTSTGYLDFSDLVLGSEIIVRNDFSITPSTNNCLLEARYLLGTGGGQYGLQFWSERLDSGSGVAYQRVTSFPIYMGDTNTQQNPGKLQVRLSTPGTLVNAGVYISIRVQGQ